MKKTFLFFCFCIFAMASLISCHSNNNENEAKLIEQIDSLKNVNASLKDLSDNLTTTLTEISACIDTITYHERIIMSGIDENGNHLNRNQIKKRLEVLSKVIQEQKERLAELVENLSSLQNMNGEKSLQISSLQNLTSYLENSLSQKDDEVERLREQLNNSNMTVTILEEKVDQITEDLNDAHATNTAQKAQIAKQEAQMNEVYYAIGTEEQLINKGVLKKEGKLIKKKKVDFSNINKSALTKADIRSLNTININGKNPKIMSEVPKGAYTLDKNSDTSYTLRITNPSLFWSANNRILIIQVGK